MLVEHVLAVVPVSDLDAARDWYTRLLGRGPDNTPMATLVEWRVTDGGWLQVFSGAGRAGGAFVNLAVDDLDDTVAELRGRALEPGQVQEASKGVRLSALADPDGNAVTLVGGFRPVY